MSFSDLRVACNALLRTPGVAATAVVTLALGIGVSALLFTIIQAVLLKPLPYPDPERIHSLRTMFSGDDRASQQDYSPVSGPVFAAWRRGCSSCESMALIFVGAVNLGGIGVPERVDALSVSSQLFPMLGIRVQLGRIFSEGEDRPGANQVVVISDSLWRRNFDADRRVIGRHITWNRTSVEIVGVLSPDFRLPRREQAGAMIAIPDRVEILRPLGVEPERLGPAFNYAALVKLRPGATVEQAAGEMDREAQRSTDSLSQRTRARLLPLKDRMVRDARKPLWILWGAAVTLLMIVCVNVGNLLMVRAAGRRREWAIRTAIGASRMDLCCQVLVESWVLAFAGSILSAGVVGIGIRLLPVFLPASLPRLDELVVDWKVLLATLFSSIAVGAVCSLAPIWQILRATPQQAFGTAARTTESKAERRGRDTLVVCEAAFSVVLASAAAFLIFSFVGVLGVDKGFNADHLLTFQLSLEGQYTGERRAQFHQGLLDRLKALPDVLSVGLTSRLPLQGETFVSELRRPGSESVSSRSQANYRYVSPEFFQTVGTAVLNGRSFHETDRARNVAVISAAAARRLFAGENPIGRAIEFEDDGGPGVLEVVGVVADVKAAGVEAEAPPAVYLPYWRIGLGNASYVVRTSNDATRLSPLIREAAFGEASDVPIYRIRQMSQIVDEAVSTRRLQASLSGGFGMLGVVLTCLGVFGVVSYRVSMQTGEIGVRMALGATRRDVTRMVIREAMEPVIAGLFCGAVLSVMIERLLASQLYGVSGKELVVLASVVILVFFAALAAACRPALHASRIEPIQALHWD